MEQTMEKYNLLYRWCRIDCI